MEKLKKIFSLIFRIGYFTALASLLLSYLAPFADPGEEFWILAFFGLAYPIILIVNVLFLIWWIICWKKLYWLSFFCILAGWMNMKNLIHFSGKPNDEPSGRQVKLLSYNVRLFDLYNWTHEEGTREKMFSFFAQESPDILCIQEFFQSEKGEHETLDTLLALTQAADTHIHYSINLKKKKQHWGIATFSKYPIVNKGKITFRTRKNNVCIFSDIKIGEDTIRVYNVHLHSVSFGRSDYRFIEALKENNDTLDTEDIEAASKNILRRIKRAFINRSYQAEKVLKHMESSPYPVVMCGDFNDTPFSYTHYLFNDKLKDAFLESGNGIGNTYNGPFPSYRIDYIFHSDSITSTDYKVSKVNYSDHYPVSATLHLRK